MNTDFISSSVEFNILNTKYKVDDETVLVLLSTYNRVGPIIGSINSIINQEYKNILLHIIDDYSSENVINIIKEYILTNNIDNVILSKKRVNSGPYINFNYILDYHKNDNYGYWILQGSDDVSDETRISKLVKFLKENPNQQSCRTKYVRNGDNIPPKYGDSMMMCRKKVFLDIGYYDNTRFGGDTDYYNRIILKYGKVGNLNEVLYYAEGGNDRLTKEYDKKEREEYVKIINQEYSKTLYRDFVELNRNSIICGLATIPSRISTLKKCIDSVINQVDKLIIYQNGYDKILDFLQNPKIEIYSSIKTGIDMGDAGKFYKLTNYDNCYYFSIDDDLIYPKTYFKDTIKRLKEFDNKIVVTYHGRSFNSFPIKSYYGSASEKYACLKTVKNDAKVQFGGTGVMCFHTSLMKIPFDYFKLPNMADIWVGKYCKETNIEIMCLKHNVGYLTYLPQKTTIYDESFKSDKNQTNIVNLAFTEKPKSLSVIIPTYNNVKYIDECINSILESGKNNDIEILVGIDACEKTLEYIKSKTYPKFVNFYYFKENLGPYLIKNSLVKIANSKNIMFFDSDDIMTETTIEGVIEKLKTFDLVRMKYQRYVNNKPQDNKNLFGEGVFSIKKSIFLEMNGFEPWKVAADSDFMGRIYKRKPRIYHTQKTSFYYRQHSESLTKRKDTGMVSPLRYSYHKISKHKKGNGNPSILHTSYFEPINIQTYVVDKEITKEHELRKEKIETVLKPTPRKEVSKKIVKSPQISLDNVKTSLEKKPELKEIIKNKIIIEEVVDQPKDSEVIINNISEIKDKIKKVINLPKETENPNDLLVRKIEIEKNIEESNNENQKQTIIKKEVSFEEDRIEKLTEKKPELVRIIKTNKPIDRQALLNKKNETNKKTLENLSKLNVVTKFKNNLGGKINR